MQRRGLHYLRVGRSQLSVYTFHTDMYRYGRLQAMRRDKRARNVPFSDNRRFSAHIRGPGCATGPRRRGPRAKCTEQACPHVHWTSFLLVY